MNGAKIEPFAAIINPPNATINTIIGKSQSFFLD